jgi:hypothetical protein
MVVVTTQRTVTTQQLNNSTTEQLDSTIDATHLYSTPLGKLRSLYFAYEYHFQCHLLVVLFFLGRAMYNLGRPVSSSKSFPCRVLKRHVWASYDGVSRNLYDLESLYRHVCLYALGTRTLRGKLPESTSETLYQDHCFLRRGCLRVDRITFGKDTYRAGLPSTPLSLPRFSRYLQDFASYDGAFRSLCDVESLY